MIAALPSAKTSENSIPAEAEIQTNAAPTAAAQAAPAPIELPPPAVRVVEPFPEYAVPRLFLWTREFERAAMDDFSPKTLPEFVALWEEMRPRRRTWGVWKGKDLGGVIQFDHLSPISGVVHCLFRKDFWGHETTIAALSMARDVVFADGIEKILATPFAHNSNVIALAKKAGFKREGLLRAQTRQNGRPIDVVVLALTKGEV